MLCAREVREAESCNDPDQAKEKLLAHGEKCSSWLLCCCCCCCRCPLHALVEQQVWARGEHLLLRHLVHSVIVKVQPPAAESRGGGASSNRPSLLQCISSSPDHQHARGSARGIFPPRDSRATRLPHVGGVVAAADGLAVVSDGGHQIILGPALPAVGRQPGAVHLQPRREGHRLAAAQREMGRPTVGEGALPACCAHRT